MRSGGLGRRVALHLITGLLSHVVIVSRFVLLPRTTGFIGDCCSAGIDRDKIVLEGYGMDELAT